MKTSRLILSFAMLLMLLGTAEAQVIAGKMVTDIQTLIPTKDPYCNSDPEDPMCEVVTVTSIPSDVVDWVLLELRTTAPDGMADAARDIVARKPAFLLSNGRVVDAAKYVTHIENALSFCEVSELTTAQNNCPDVGFSKVAIANNKELYLVVRHRNHLDVISSSSITGVMDTNKNTDVYSYDFSNDAALKDRGDVFVMYGGDVNRDGTVNITDYSGAATDIGQSLYHAGDTNFSGIVTPADYSDIIANNLVKSSQVPGP